MIKGIYASGSSMKPRMLRLEVIANNLANIETTGFKKEQLFVQILAQAGESLQTSSGGDTDGIIARQYIDLTGGNLRQTGNPLDMALEGDGFFLVDTPNGPRLTRDGTFRLSPEGNVVTSQGFELQTTSGPLHVPFEQANAETTISISESGEVMVGKQIAGSLKIMKVDDPLTLRKDGSTLFMVTDPSAMTEMESGTAHLRQGYLEESNVEGIAEMIEMVELNRSFESDQKSITYQDGTLQHALDVGRI